MGQLSGPTLGPEEITNMGISSRSIPELEQPTEKPTEVDLDEVYKEEIGRLIYRNGYGIVFGIFYKDLVDSYPNDVRMILEGVRSFFEKDPSKVNLQFKNSIGRAYRESDRQMANEDRDEIVREIGKFSYLKGDF